MWIVITLLSFVTINLSFVVKGTKCFFITSIILLLFQVIMIIAGAALYFRIWDSSHDSSKLYLGCYRMWAVSVSICGLWIGLPLFFLVFFLWSLCCFECAADCFTCINEFFWYCMRAVL